LRTYKGFIQTGEAPMQTAPIDRREPTVSTCERGHPLTPDNLQKIGKAGVRCKTCRRRIAREHVRRKTGFYARNPGAQVSA
jgi:hypothetical protein